jgi:hypothetical protein
VLTGSDCPCLDYANSTNAAECVPPAIQEVVEIIAELISALRLSSLSACGCTAHEIIALLAVLLKVVIISMLAVFLVRSRSYAIDHLRTPWVGVRLIFWFGVSSRSPCVSPFFVRFSVLNASEYRPEM